MINVIIVNHSNLQKKHKDFTHNLIYNVNLLFIIKIFLQYYY